MRTSWPALPIVISLMVVVGCSAAATGHGSWATVPPATHDQLTATLPTLVDMPDLSWQQTDTTAPPVGSIDTKMAKCTGTADTVPDRRDEASTHDLYWGQLDQVVWAHGYASPLSVAADLVRVRSPRFLGCAQKLVLDTAGVGSAEKIAHASTHSAPVGRSGTIAVTIEMTVDFTGDDHEQHVEYTADTFVFGHQVDGELYLQGIDTPIPASLQAAQVAKFADRMATIP